MRVVAPWTWRIALRDHGPRSSSLLCTLFIIGTYMNDSGYAFPGQVLIAKGARASLRTVQRHIAEARKLGWLVVEFAGRGGQGWRHSAYRCAIPDNLALTEKSEELADKIVSQLVNPDGDDTSATPPMVKGNGTAMSSRSVTSSEGDDIDQPKVTTNDSEGDDTSEQKVATQLCRTNSYSETHAYRTPTPEEAHANTIAPGRRPFSETRKKKPEELEADALQRAETLAASIRFRDRRSNECPRAYAVAVIQAQAAAMSELVTLPETASPNGRWLDALQ